MTIFGAVFVVVVVAVAFYVFQKLPSASVIGEALKPAPATVAEPRTLEQEVAESNEVGEMAVASDDASIADDSEIENSQIKEAMIADMISPQKPLSDFCSSLKNAKSGPFEQEEFGEAFDHSLDEDTRDPRIQAVKPMLRYVMRLPKVTDLITEAQAAVGRNDEGFLKKAEFYQKAFSAFTEMTAHKSDIESVMDRSYLLLGLNNLMAAKPDLLKDSRVQNYCGGIELSFNQARPVDFDNEKKEFLNFLSDLKVEPKEIGFNPNYKSKIDLKFTAQTLTFEGGWLSDIVKNDVEMEADLKKNN